ncbi:hypothetical protein ZYGR_0S00200 [Zygosaccharomyces rouxii]|uniref:ZYRO0F02926p n=2 Tax=Zygosaccharomyces rouxii TaxID=4956 RepID=C5DX81_ZYGRC|nr:uncharacterized protein ZYRO0F02926g [Zygosaccharomyces rouxii]KAH9199156.1 hypothetical protein LQ764DRAFT_235017 [Zygosaccharomyces rouxii]GAV49888.1 hypothetical protein ZYGR_0S00200 [Zygosaccharomyces rouxii]CAR28392.1 ZYRO0F02926p [Zygosaccharomyces rouxii]
MSLPVHHGDTLPPQEVIDLFKRTFSHELYEDLANVRELVQKVKSDLYNRDYTAAFDDNAKRVAYCCRWSPARAVAYTSLFAQLEPINQVVRCQLQGGDQRVLCVGGGAGGELVALASLFTPSRHVRTPSNEGLQIHLVDIYDWTNVVSRLQDQINTNWLYNGQSRFCNMEFTSNDILKMDPGQLQLNQLNLITLLFTTNELFSQDKSGSIKFLQSLTTHCQRGCLLLITESAGSYSHITVGSKKFPIQFLIDTVLLGKRGQDNHGNWTLVDQSDSIWYRGDPDMDYPLKLENMRCFYRLYRKL